MIGISGVFNIYVISLTGYECLRNSWSKPGHKML